MKTLTIIRGIPGSGKSTLAAKINPSYIEADQFFEIEGKYRFDRNKLGEAHRWCFREVNLKLANDEDCVVSNTFTVWKELRPYIELAFSIGMRKEQIQIITVSGRFGSIHSVPEETLLLMEKRFAHSDFKDEINAIFDQ